MEEERTWEWEENSLKKIECKTDEQTGEGFKRNNLEEERQWLKLPTNNSCEDESIIEFVWI